ncbi:MAG: serine protease, partial [Actinomycetota bacterium]|nr:serine protease [Actinomycetota bacterium]
MSLIVAVLVPLLAAPANAAPNSQGAGLDRHDRELLAQARANGETTIRLLIASRANKNSDVARGIEALGGRIEYRDDPLGYARAVVPIDRAEQAARVTGVQSADVDEIIPLDDPRPDAQTAPTPYPAPDASTPRDNPYMPIAETGADAFMDTHPTWDGRGVTVGVLDTGITLDHPALATTTTGAPKVIDWVTYTDPLTDGDPTWVTTSPVNGPTFSSGGVSYTAPAGAFRFGVFDERSPRLGGEVGSDVNRDGNPEGSSGLFGVLWDGATTVWVDVDQDRDFTDEPA